jgi:F-type H+-transporting ATPase subunit a
MPTPIERELWISIPFNRLLAGPANSVLKAVGLPAHDPAHPWANWLTCEILVVALIVVLFAYLRSRLSVDKPGKLQHCFEIIYEFLDAQAEEVVGHGSRRFLAFFGTLFIFILFLNLLGVIPTLESPTMDAVVPFGFAAATFVYYNSAGLRVHGIGGYIKQFMGPMLLLAPVMLPIELVSHFARPLSLTIRLYANMFAGEQVTATFLGLTFIIIPAVFMVLHIFVSILQAYIFALLAMIYVGGAVAQEH